MTLRKVAVLAGVVLIIVGLGAAGYAVGHSDAPDHTAAKGERADAYRAAFQRARREGPACSEPGCGRTGHARPGHAREHRLCHLPGLHPRRGLLSAGGTWADRGADQLSGACGRP